MRSVRLRWTAERATAYCVLAAVTFFMLWQLYPSLLVRDVTPAFNDLPGHYVTARQFRYRLLPQGQVFGWSMAWFTGYPMLTFYVPVGTVVVGLLGLLLPLNVALKVVAAAGPVTLPLAAYAFGRLNGRDRLYSACLSVAVLPLLLEQLLSISGGSMWASIGSGEYAYGLAFSLGLLVLGVAGRSLLTGRHRGLTACLLAVAGLCHVVPGAFAFAGVGVMALLRRGRDAFRWAIPVVAVAVALMGVWLVPLLLRIGLTAGLPTPGSTPIARWLFPVTMAPVAVLAGAGLVVRLLKLMTGTGTRDDLFNFMGVMAVASGTAFALYPAGRIGIARFVPVWLLWLSLLAGDAFAMLGSAVDEARRKASRGRNVHRPALVRSLVPVAAFLAVLPVWNSRLGTGLLPGTHPDASARLRSSLAGYESGPQAQEFRDLEEMLQRIGRERGCGRTDWEWAEDTRGASVVAFMFLVPHHTDGCMQVTEGSWTQVSPNTKFLDVTNQRLSANPVVLQGEKHSFDIARGVADLRMQGVRYFVAGLARTRAAADASPDLRPVAETSPRAGEIWKVYEVVGRTDLVEPLAHAPVVVPGIGRSRGSWEREVGAWYDRSDREVLVAAAGPAAWPRSRRTTDELPRRALPATAVSDVRIGDDRISFRVSRPGTPVLVKVSYFPNWKADGARGPWRVAPNQMVVVPTSEEVTLRYERSAAEHTGRLITLGGIAGVVAMARRGPLEPLPASEQPAPSGRTSPSRVKRPTTSPGRSRRGRAR